MRTSAIFEHFLELPVTAAAELLADALPALVFSRVCVCSNGGTEPFRRALGSVHSSIDVFDFLLVLFRGDCRRSYPGRNRRRSFAVSLKNLRRISIGTWGLINVVGSARSNDVLANLHRKSSVPQSVGAAHG